MMRMKLISTMSISMLLSACAFVDLNPPEESQAALPRTSKPADIAAPISKTSAAMESQSGIWLAKKTTGQSTGLEQTASPVTNWEILRSDRTLKMAISRWAAKAGWQLIWELKADYEVEVNTTITGTFEDAMAAVVNSMENSEAPMKVIFYKSNKVVRIVTRGAK